MDAKETIGRAVAKVKGECWHEGMQHTKMWGGMHYVDRCGRCGDTVNLRHPDYTSEANIREAVRVLLRNSPERAERFADAITNCLAIANPPSGYDADDVLDMVLCPKESHKEALLSIAQEILEEHKVKDAKV